MTTSLVQAAPVPHMNSSQLVSHQKTLPDNESVPGIPTLAIREYGYQGQLKPLQSEPLVLIHGWGCDSKIWQALLPELTQHLNVITLDLPGFGDSEFFHSKSSSDTSDADITVDHYLNSILAVLPERCSLMGWSLGGMLATALASRYPQRFNHLITIASNPSFVQKKGWLSAMPKKTFSAFLELFQQQPALCLKRFYGLQCQGDQHERNTLKALKAIVDQGVDFGASLNVAVGDSTESNHSAWLHGLGLLTEIDNRAAMASLEVRGLHLFGEADQLVPAAVADVLSDICPQQKIDVIKSTGHVPQLSCPQLLTSKILEFFKAERYHLDKKRVANSFSRAAQSYDSVARLQCKAGQHLLTLLPKSFLTKQSQQIVDLGCGTGYLTEQLTEQLVNQYSVGQNNGADLLDVDMRGPNILGIDLAQGMLAFAREKHDGPITWLCGDAECLPLADNSVDLMFSNLAFQWCEQLPELAAEIARVLKPGGILAFTSLGHQTLCELRQSWAKVDDYIHVNRFMDAQQWQQAFSQSGLAFNHFDVDAFQLEYQDLRHLTDELKGVGAHNVNSGQNRGLTSPKQIRTLMQAYEQYRNKNGQLPATWEVIYGVATLGASTLNA